MKKIKIIDAIMGSGKTHNAIEKMKKHCKWTDEDENKS